MGSWGHSLRRPGRQRTCSWEASSWDTFLLSPQVEGAFVQGMGLYTIEELNYSPQGVLYSRGPNQYKIPAICDIPTEMHVFFLPPSENSNTLYSSKVSCAR